LPASYFSNKLKARPPKPAHQNLYLKDLNMPKMTSKPRLTKTRIIQAVCGLLLLALFGMACSSGDSPELVSVPDTPTPETLPPVVDPTTTQVTATTASPSDPTATEPPSEPPPDNVVVNPTIPGIPDISTTSAPPNTGSGPSLAENNKPSPYGNSFSATVIIANGPDQRRVPLYDAPNGNEIALPDGGLWYRSYYNGALVMQVVEGSQSDAWVRVNVAARQLAPERNCTVPPCYKNGVSGWVQNQGFDWFTHRYHGIIDLSEKSVRLWNGDELIAETLAVIGRPTRETPLGTFFLKEKLPPPNAAYGPHVLSLSAYSEQLREFQGGLPNIALHGTNQPGLIGQAVSSGCIRVPNNVITTINNAAPLGTIFEIVV